VFWILREIGCLCGDGFRAPDSKRRSQFCLYFRCAAALPELGEVGCGCPASISWCCYQYWRARISKSAD
jgi:hypothetical protein